MVFWRKNDGQSSDKLEVFADPISINCRKVLAGFKMLDVPYELKYTDYFAGEQKSAEYLAINPNAALPTMRDGDVVLWESNAILQYAADKSGKTEFYPLDFKKRTEINRWLFWECGQWFNSCYIFLVENCVKPHLGAEPDNEILNAELENYNKLASLLNKRLGSSRFICGETPTIADVAVAAPMHLHVWSKLPLQDHPNITRWISQDIEPQSWWKDTHVGEGFTWTKTA